jgi:RNA polymerase sigma-70 factor (ECF subfamily)
MAEGPETRPSLLLRLRDARDDRAWAEFVALYTPLVYGFARKQGLQDADAADLTQDVMRAVAGSIGRLDYDPKLGTFRGWLFTLVRHSLSDFRQRSRRQVQGSGDSDQLVRLDLNPTPDQGLEEEWQREYERHLFAAAADRVKGDVQPTTWTAFWRTTVEEHAPGTVAVDLGLSLASVYLAKSRVMARLREQVRAWDDE